MISGKILRDAIISGANNINNQRSRVDELNVFPVPDGDTGTNMGMTVGASVRELEALDDSCTVGEASKTAASAMLRGARGNSGVITSLLFRGFSKALEGKKEASAADIVEALKKGVEGAYKAVMKPTEGTILTVARVASEEAAACGAEDVPALWDVVMTAGIHNAGLFQHGQQVGSVLQSLLARSEDDVPQLGHILLAAGGSFLRSHAGHGQDGALGGLHDGLVSALDALLERRDDVGGVGLLLALQSLGEAAEQQAGDDAGVAARTAQHGGGSGLGGLADGAAVVQSFQLTDGGTDGHAHVGAGVAIGDGEDVQLVHAGALIVDVVRAGDDRVAQDLTRNHLNLLLIVLSDQAITSSTETITRATFRPVACSTSSLTRCEMLRAAVEMFSP